MSFFLCTKIINYQIWYELKPRKIGENKDIMSTYKITYFSGNMCNTCQAIKIKYEDHLSNRVYHKYTDSTYNIHTDIIRRRSYSSNYFLFAIGHFKQIIRPVNNLKIFKALTIEKFIMNKLIV